MKTTYSGNPARVLLINGCPGAGKTTTATHLAVAIDGVIIDGEKIGRRIQRTFRVQDYQYSLIWRTCLVTTTILQIVRGRPIMIPMTLLDPRVRAATIGLLRRLPIKVDEIFLHASEHSLVQRVRSRGGPGTHWCLAELPRFLNYPLPSVDCRINTDAKSPEGVICNIQSYLQLS